MSAASRSPSSFAPVARSRIVSAAARGMSPSCACASANAISTSIHAAIVAPSVHIATAGWWNQCLHDTELSSPIESMFGLEKNKHCHDTDYDYYNQKCKGQQ